MSHDQAVFQDPEEFRPERYLDDTEQTDVYPRFTHNEGHTSFGYGRRKCVGQDIAKNALFTIIFTLLWTFNIEKAKDVDGTPITPDKNDLCVHGVVTIPAPFPVSFMPRLPGSIDLIRTAIADAIPV